MCGIVPAQIQIHLLESLLSAKESRMDNNGNSGSVKDENYEPELDPRLQDLLARVDHRMTDHWSGKEPLE
jgi:hypothetical protein